MNEDLMKWGVRLTVPNSRVKDLIRVVGQQRLRGQRAAMRNLVALMGGIVLPVAGCAWSLTAAGQPASTTAKPLIGVYEPGAPASWAGLAGFTSTTGVQPKVVVYYSGWYEKFWSGFASAAAQHAATVLVQLDPGEVRLTSISAGKSDAYLRSYAKSVKTFAHPVLLSFGHEMNGDWYPWASGHVSPATFIMAWRHVVQIFREEGVPNVRWVWTVSSLNEASGPLRPWWPGSSWVNFVGIDGYYYTAGSTYSSVFGMMLRQIKKFTKGPVLISEVGIGPNPNRAKQIAALYADAASDRFAGIVWFDVPQSGGPFRQNWRLEDDPVALAAFAKAVHSCCQ